MYKGWYKNRGDNPVVPLSICTGLGQVMGENGEAPLKDGVPVPQSPHYLTVASASVTIGGVSAPVVFAGLTPSFVGLYQVNVTVPSNIQTGSRVLVKLSGGNLGGSTPLYLNIVN